MQRPHLTIAASRRDERAGVVGDSAHLGYTVLLAAGVEGLAAEGGPGSRPSLGQLSLGQRAVLQFPLGQGTPPGLQLDPVRLGQRGRHGTLVLLSHGTTVPTGRRTVVRRPAEDEHEPTDLDVQTR